MTEPARDDKIQVLRARPETWASQNPVLLPGEHGLEQDPAGEGPDRFKVGDGRSRWLELDYFIPETVVLQAIQAAIDALPPQQGGGGGEVTMAMLTAHINSLTPHPVYDEGDSFVGLYRNAKV